TRLLGVERGGADHVGQRRERAPCVHLGLRALGLELVEDAREGVDLRLVEPQLEGQEAERPPDAERSGAEVAVSARREAEAAELPGPVAVALASLAAVGGGAARLGAAGL